MIQFHDQDGSVELKVGNLSRIKWGRNEGQVSKFEINFPSIYSKAPSAWYWQKNKSLKYLPEKFNLAMDFWSWNHAVNKRNVWNKDNWTRSSLVLVQNSLHLSETFKTLKGNLTDLFRFLLNNQTLIMIMLTNIHIWICLVFKKSQGSPLNAVL